MDERIRSAVESAYSIEREYGFACDAQSRSDATFVAAERVAETHGTEVLGGCPDWLIAELNQWVAMYREHGRFGFISNLGEVDHSALLGRVAKILASKGDAA